MRNDNDADAFIRLGEMLSKERGASHDLWTWLPSFEVARKYHGDYAFEFCPSPHDVMREATLYLTGLKYPNDQEGREWFERCPCGEEHEAGNGEE